MTRAEADMLAHSMMVRACVPLAVSRQLDDGTWTVDAYA